VLNLGTALGVATLGQGRGYRTTGVSKLYGTQAAISEPSLGGTNRYVIKVQAPGPAKRARLYYMNKAANVEARAIRASIAPTDRKSVATAADAYNAYQGGSTHNADYPGDPWGFRRFLWAGASSSGVLQASNAVLPSFGFSNQMHMLRSDWVDLVPIRATDRTPEEYYFILRIARDGVSGDGEGGANSGFVNAQMTRWNNSDGADTLLVWGNDPGSETVTAYNIPATNNGLSIPHFAIEWDYGFKARTMWAVGDSVTESYLWPQIATSRKSKASAPWHSVNIGGSTTRTESFFGNMYLHLQQMTKPDYILLPSMSINNYSPATNFTLSESQNVQWPRLQTALNFLIGLGIKPIVWTNYNWGVDTDLNSAIGYINDQVRQFCGSGRAVLCDINRDPSFDRRTIGAAPSSGWIANDNTHPSDPYGIEGFAANLASVLAGLN
jgi:hypothetical protein